MFEFSEESKTLAARLLKFRDEFILPNEERFNAEVEEGTPWKPVPVMEELRAEARRQGLWNLFAEPPHGPGLSNLDYAPLAEVMGCNEWTPEVFNSNPPDSGNMGLLLKYANEEQKDRWLAPLLAGEIRSCFAMTEPEVASSDATNNSTRAELDGDHWVINGEKWFIGGPGNPLCRIAVVMCKTNPEAERYKQHSMILVPLDTPGVKIKRMLKVMGFDYAPRGHANLTFENVRVPVSNVLLGAGRGFEIAQGRLGPGRLHHAMRCVGAAERAFALMCGRGLKRVAFGKPIARLGGNSEHIARSRIEIEMVRLLVLRTSWLLDNVGAHAARSEISQAKVAAPEMACRVVDRAMQMHGAAGLSQDTPLSVLYARLRTLRIVDGPDEVHLRVIAREELSKFGSAE
jgi:acyl-CoA dehydrogenase